MNETVAAAAAAAALSPDALAALVGTLGTIMTCVVGGVKALWPKKVKETKTRLRVVSVVIGSAISVGYMLFTGLDPIANVAVWGGTVLAGVGLHEIAKFLPWATLAVVLEKVAKRWKKKG